MTLQEPRSLFDDKNFGVATSLNSLEQFQTYKPRWHFTREEIERHSPSRNDGISHEQESHLRQLFCSYLQDLGMELKVPQVTIASAMILCHRFYMHQSHAKNHWQAVANASMFLACKADDTPRWLRDIIVVAYKLMYHWDPSAPQRIKQKEVYDKQKNFILVGERLILATVAFDLNIQLPYKPLVAALNSMEISQKEVAKVAWNFVNDWLRTTLCLQYKPHYIAAGSIFLAAKFQKIKLPSSSGKAWWMQFDVSPKQLEEVIQNMLQLLGQSRKRSRPLTRDPETKTEPICRKRKSESSDSCISNERTVHDSRNSTKATVLSTSAVVKSNRKQQDADANDTVNRTEGCRMNYSGCTNSVIEDGDGEVITNDSYQISGSKIVSVKGSCQKIDVAELRERLKRRKSSRMETKESGNLVDEEINSEAWIERELENGIESVFTL